MPVQAVPDNGATGRRIVIERPPVIVEGVTDYNVEDDGLMRLWCGDKPAGDFKAGTYEAVYYAAEKQAG